MKPIQQDDIQEYLNKPKRKFRFIHIPTKRIVRAENKSNAIKELIKHYNIHAKRIDVRIASIFE